MAVPHYRILITDDDLGIRETLQEIIELQGYQSIVAANGNEALEIVQHEPHLIHLALFDMHMPKLTGLETYQLIKQINQMLPAILITADITLELMRKAFEAQVFSVLPKPVDAGVVVHTVTRALVRVYGTVDEPPPGNLNPGPGTH